MSEPERTLGPEELLTHRRFLRSVARALVGNTPDADDLTQEVWLKVTRAHGVRDHAPRSWLFTAARHLAASTARSAKRRATRERAVVSESTLTDPSEILAREEVRREVLQAVLDLPDTYRDAVLLRYLHELPLREVAKRLDISENTAGSRLLRARRLLRERLEARANHTEVDLLGGIVLLSGDASRSTAITIGSLLMAKGLWLGAGLCALLITVAAFFFHRPDLDAMSSSERTSSASAVDGAALAAQDSSDLERQFSEPLNATRRATETTISNPESAPGVTGLVISTTGDPIPNARVVRTAEFGLGTPLATSTDEQGRFALPADGASLRLQVGAPGFAERSVDVIAGHDVTVVLRPGHVLRWQVVDAATGAAIPDAVARLRVTSTGVVRVLHVDGEGRLITTTPAYATSISFDADGYVGWKEEPLQGLGPVERVVRLPRLGPPGAVRLRLLDHTSDRPLPLATVNGTPVAIRGDGSAEALVPRTDGNARVEIRSDGYVPATLDLSPDVIGSDGIQEVRMRRATRLHLAVTDPEGRPIRGARVSLFDGSLPVDPGPHTFAWQPPTTTDEHGLASFENLLEGATCGVVVQHRDWLPLPRQRITIDAASEQRLEPFVLSRGRAANGRVLDEDGAPIAGALIEIVPGFSRAVSDASGRFVLEPVPEVTRVRATAPDFLTASADAEPDAEVTIVLQRGATIRGIVLTEDDQPAVGVDVAAHDEDFEATAQTSRDGTFTIRGLPSDREYSLWAVDGAMEARIPNIDEPDRRVKAGETGVRLRLLPPSGFLVRAVNSAGVLLHDFDVTVVWQDTGPPGVNRGVGFTQRDADGRAFLPAVAGDTLDLVVRAEGYGEFAQSGLTVGPGIIREVVAKLQPPSVVTGTLVDEDGHPVAGSTLLLIRVGVETFRHPQAITTDDGAFRIEGVGIGRYRLQVKHLVSAASGASTEQQIPVIPSHVDVGAGPNHYAIRLMAGPPTSLSGRVMIDIADVVSFEVHLWQLDEASGADDPHHVRLVTGEDHRFHVDGIPPGRYRTDVRMTVRNADGNTFTRIQPADPTKLDVAPAGETTVDLRIE